MGVWSCSLPPPPPAHGVQAYLCKGRGIRDERKRDALRSHFRNADLLLLGQESENPMSMCCEGLNDNAPIISGLPLIPVPKLHQRRALYVSTGTGKMHCQRFLRSPINPRAQDAQPIQSGQRGQKNSNEHFS